MSYTDHANGAFLTRRGNYNVSSKILDQVITLSRYFDASVDNLASGAYYKIFSVPANFLLTEAYITCVTGDGSTETIDLVDDDSATTTFVSSAEVGTGDEGKTGATNARKLYTSAGFICLKPDAALDAAKFWVVVKGIVLNTSM